MSADPAVISARLDRLPPSRAVWGWVARVSFGGFFEIYETALTTVLAPGLKRAGIFHVGRDGLFGAPDLATFAFASFVGLFLGAVVFSAIADRIGRRPVFVWALIGYALATVGMALQADAASICGWRFIASVGVGAEIVATDAYLSELLPKGMRGRGFALSKAMQYTAVPLAGILAAVVAGKVICGVAGWRILLGVPVIGAVLIFWIRAGLPESPRWLAAHKRGAEADAILSAVEHKISKATGRDLPAIMVTEPAFASNEIFAADLFHGPLLRRLIVVTIVSCAVTIAYFGFGNWLPTLLEKRGVTISRSLLYTALIALTYPLTPLLFSGFADALERKWQIALGAGGVAVGGLAFAAQHSMSGWLVCGIVVSLSANLAAYSTHTYRSELFPTPLRGRAIGLIYALDRLTAACNSYLIGFILVGAGVAGVLGFVVAAALVAAIVVLAAGPRTRGLSPEEITDALAPLSRRASAL